MSVKAVLIIFAVTLGLPLSLMSIPAPTPANTAVNTPFHSTPLADPVPSTITPVDGQGNTGYGGGGGRGPLNE